MGRIELFRISGIPIYLDIFFILIAVLFTWPYWSAGGSTGMSAGFVLVLGLFVSILLHELGHAWAGRWFGIGAQAIELNGLGGLCYFDRSLPARVLPRTVIGLAGPFANLVLWQVFDVAAAVAQDGGGGMLAMVLRQLAYVNLLLLIFNLLPAFPLDGGKVLEAWLAPIFGPAWSVRVVAVLGLAVAAWLLMRSFPGSLFMVMLAVLLAIANWQMLQSVGGFGRR
jgi:Zn-dependent protease